MSDTTSATAQQDNDKSAAAPELSTIAIVLIVLGVVVVPLTLIVMGKCLERRFKYSPAARNTNQVHNSKKADGLVKVKETPGKLQDSSVTHMIGDKGSTTYDVSMKLSHQKSSGTVKVTIDQLKEEVASEFHKKEAMVRKMNNQEKTLFSLFQGQTRDRLDNNGSAQKIHVEVVDRPDIEQAIVTKIQAKPQYDANISETISIKRQRTLRNSQLDKLSLGMTNREQQSMYSFSKKSAEPNIEKKRTQSTRNNDPTQDNSHELKKVVLLRTGGGGENESVHNAPHQKLRVEFEDEFKLGQDISPSGENTFDLPPKTTNLGLIDNCGIQGKPKSSGVLKVPIKRTVTMQPKKTVTFTAQKVSMHIDNSLGNGVTNMSATKKEHAKITEVRVYPESDSERHESPQHCLDLSNDRQAQRILNDLRTPDVSDLKFLGDDIKDDDDCQNVQQDLTPAFRGEDLGPILPRWHGPLKGPHKKQTPKNKLSFREDIQKLIQHDGSMSQQPSPILLDLPPQDRQKDADSSSFLTSNLKSDLGAAN